MPLLQLSLLPLTALTLPEPLWRRSMEDKRTASFCEGLLAIADRLGFLVSATGIRTQAELRHVKQLGCQRGQGSLWTLGSQPPKREDSA